jgi:hypothetical protein
MFRRRACDETILCAAKPFSAFGAEVPKRALTINLPTKRRQRREPGACQYVERHRHQRRRQEEYRHCARDNG